jgi:thioredoxin-like negative regulator of GroEL
MPVSEITTISRHEFAAMLTNNSSVIILKFGAEWCGPCKTIEKEVVEYMNKMPENYTCMILDIDECFDLYAYLKSKKIVTSIPCMIAYFKGNAHYAPDEIMIGTNLEEIEGFFQACLDA